MNKKEVKHINHPLIDLSDILEVLFFDHQFAKCWTCKKTCHQTNLQVKVGESGWTIICKRCNRVNYFSA